MLLVRAINFYIACKIVLKIKGYLFDFKYIPCLFRWLFFQVSYWQWVTNILYYLPIFFLGEVNMECTLETNQKKSPKYHTDIWLTIFLQIFADLFCDIALIESNITSYKICITTCTWVYRLILKYILIA